MTDPRNSTGPDAGKPAQKDFTNRFTSPEAGGAVPTARPDYTNEAQQRLCRMLVLMAGNEFMGVSPSELAKALNTNPSNVTRDLANLRTAGLAEEMADTGKWRLGPKLIQIALAFSDHASRMTDRLAEINNRYTRLP